MRFNLSMAIVAMVNSTKVSSHDAGDTVQSPQATSNLSLSHGACSHLRNTDEAGRDQAGDDILAAQGEFHWSEADQGIILGIQSDSFY